MNQLLVNLISGPTSKQTEGVQKEPSKTKDSHEKFEAVINKISKKIDEKPSVISKKEVGFAKNKKLNLAELEDMAKTPLELDEGMQEVMILNLLADYLKLPVEDLQKTLESLQMEPIDLLDKVQFGEFINSLYGPQIEKLLLSHEDIKNINALWEQIEGLDETVNLPAQEEKVISDNQIQNSIEKAENKSIEEVNILPEGSIEISAMGSEIIGKEEAKSIKQTNDINPLTEEAIDLTNKLGLPIPIEAFNATAGAKMWQQLPKEQMFTRMIGQATVESQILNKIEISKVESGKEIQIDLTPRELGKLSFKLIETNGIFTAQIRVENEKTKELVLQSIETLKESFEEQGLTIGDFSVNVQDHSRQSQMQQERQKSSKRIEDIINKHLQEVEQEEVEETKITDSKVDIMA